MVHFRRFLAFNISKFVMQILFLSQIYVSDVDDQFMIQFCTGLDQFSRARPWMGLEGEQLVFLLAGCYIF